MKDAVVELVKCSTPTIMICDLCESCKRNQPKTSEDDSFEYYSLKKTLMNGWKCDGYLSKS